MARHERTLRFSAVRPLLTGTTPDTPRPGRAWYVLTDGEKFWGLRWEIYNSTLRRPRFEMGPLDGDRSFKARLCHGKGEASWEQRLALEQLGLKLEMKRIGFSRERQEARIFLEKGE